MKLLFVVPPIFDFAAYDFWMKPYGFLQIAAALKNIGHKIKYFDFLDRMHPVMQTKNRSFGRGNYFTEIVQKPRILSDIPRNYRRFGLPKKIFRQFLKNICNTNKPDAVLVSVAMTYWYPGLQEVISIINEFWQDLPIIVGGVYASLCADFARKKHPEIIVADDFKPLSDFLCTSINKDEIINQIPDWSLYPKLHYGIIKLSAGCPFKCTYCASPVLSGNFRIRDRDIVMNEVSQLLNNHTG